MEYDEADYLMLSGLQHFAFCRRQWALIHLDGEWGENVRTVEGELLHHRVHDPFFFESRSKVVYSRAMPVCSRRLGISGECDMVEFHSAPEGVALQRRTGSFLPYPVEYKRGRPKDEEIDRLQLTAQALCLEEMFCCNVSEGALYYEQIRRRERVVLTAELRRQVEMLTQEMHRCAEKGTLPKAAPKRGCSACSLREICLPRLSLSGSAKRYNDDNLGGAQ